MQKYFDVESKGKIYFFCYIHSLLHKMMLSIVEGKRNKPMLLLDTFRYTQDKILKTTIYWKSENRSCLGRTIQYTSQITRPVNDRIRLKYDT